jgi:hypothetical protein
MPSLPHPTHDPLSNFRAAVVAAIEALEVGDQRAVCAILLAALEDGPVLPEPWSCPHCPGASYPWVGLLERHMVVVHGEELQRAA